MGLLKNLFGSTQAAPPCAIHPNDRAFVRDIDFAWWSELSLDDCKSFEHEDNVFKLSAMTKFTKTDGLSTTEAVKKLRMSFPYYYSTLQDRDDERVTLLGVDAKIPYILKKRINHALMTRKIDAQALGDASSFNALARDLMRSGEI